MSFLGGGEGLSGAGGSAGGFGARLGFPWLTRGRSDRSDVERDAAGVGVGGADDNEVIEPPRMELHNIMLPQCNITIVVKNIFYLFYFVDVLCLQLLGRALSSKKYLPNQLNIFSAVKFLSPVFLSRVVIILCYFFN